MAAETTDTARLFFALWPDTGVQRALGALAQDLSRECGGRAPAARNIHLTLVFLGNVERERLPRLEEIAVATSAPPFDLNVDRVEYWRHNRIIWAGVEQCPEALAGLVARLERALAPEGFRFDDRAYVPHITLLRNARRAPLSAAVPVVAWPVSRYALVESVPRGQGRLYEVLREWPLVG